MDTAGNIYVIDTGDHRVRRVDTSEFITVFAGTGESGYSGDGEPAIRAELSSPRRITVDSAGHVFVVDRGNSAVRVMDPSGTIKTVAGSGRPGREELQLNSP